MCLLCENSHFLQFWVHIFNLDFVYCWWKFETSTLRQVQLFMICDIFYQVRSRHFPKFWKWSIFFCSGDIWDCLWKCGWWMMLFYWGPILLQHLFPSDTTSLSNFNHLILRWKWLIAAFDDQIFQAKLCKAALSCEHR